METRPRRQQAGAGRAGAIALLKKVFELEARKGFRDEAVAGGIERLLPAQAGRLPEQTRFELRDLLRGYHELGRQERQSRIEAALELLDASSSVTSEKPPTPVLSPSPAPEQ